MVLLLACMQEAKLRHTTACLLRSALMMELTGAVKVRADNFLAGYFKLQIWYSPKDQAQ